MSDTDIVPNLNWQRPIAYRLSPVRLSPAAPYGINETGWTVAVGPPYAAPGVDLGDPVPAQAPGSNGASQSSTPSWLPLAVVGLAIWWLSSR
jgi:hypothetical protein